MEDLSTILIIAGILNFIVLIVFFTMAGNISKILKHLTKRNSYINYVDLAEEEYYLGNKEKAREYLLRAELNAKKSIEKVEKIVAPSLGANFKDFEEIKKDLEEISEKLKNFWF